MQSNTDRSKEYVAVEKEYVAVEKEIQKHPHQGSLGGRERTKREGESRQQVEKGVEKQCAAIEKKIGKEYIAVEKELQKQPHEQSLEWSALALGRMPQRGTPTQAQPREYKSRVQRFQTTLPQFSRPI